MRSWTSPSDANDNGRRGNELFLRYKQSRDHSALDGAIRAYCLATLADPARRSWWRNLAVALLNRHAITDSPDDCDQAIAALTEAINLAGVDRAGRADLAQLLGLAWEARFEATGEPADLATSDHAFREALDPSDPDPAVLWQLTSTAWRLFQASGQLDTLDNAAMAYQEALALVPENEPRFPDLSENASIAFRTRFERSGRPADLAEAIMLARRSCTATSSNDPRLPVRLTHLAGALMYQWELLPETHLLDEAITSYDQAVKLMPSQHPELSNVLTNLAGTLLMRAWRSDDQADLNQAIKFFREATELPNGTDSLGNLASALTARYDATHNVMDIDEAIAAGQRAAAVKRVPHDLSILAHALVLRAGHDGAHDTTALTEAARLYRECLARSPVGGQYYAEIISDLGHTLEQLDSTDAEAARLFCQAASWTAPASLEAVTPGKVGIHGVKEGVARGAAGTGGQDGVRVACGIW